MATIEQVSSARVEEEYSEAQVETASPIEAALQRVYALNWEFIIYFIIFGIALFTRFWDLGTRVMSHDESLHTYYSWLLYNEGNFDHNPLMHGPLLFHMTAFFYYLFGPGDFSARIFTALLGVAIVMFPLLWRRWLGRLGAIMASIGLLISPMLLYYSRYIRHDIPSIFFALVMVYAILQYVDGKRPRNPIWIGVLAGAMLLMLASKEVAFMYIAIFGSFFTFYWIMRLIQDMRFRKSNPIENSERFAARRYSRAGAVPLFDRLYGLAGTVISSAAIAMVLIFLQYLVAPPLGFFGNSESIGDLIGSSTLNEYPIVANISLVQTGIWLGITVALSVLLTIVGMPRRITNAMSGSPRWQLLIGHLAAILAALLLGAMSGSVIATFVKETYNPPPATLYKVGMAAVFLLLFEGIGFFRSLFTNEPRPGIGQMMVNGLSNTRSALLLIIAGTMIGSLAALWSFGVLDVVKPYLADEAGCPAHLSCIWENETYQERINALIRERQAELNEVDQAIAQTTDPVQRAELQEQSNELQTEINNLSAQLPQGMQKIQANGIEVNEPNLERAGLWLLVPLAILMFIVFFIAALKVQRGGRFAWQDVGIVLLVALLVFGVLMVMERRSLESDKDTEQEPVAVTPDGQPVEPTDEINEAWIYLTWIVGGLATVLVLVTRVATHWWDYLNRQPIFDVLIVMGTLILPWLAAVPLFVMGHTLDEWSPSALEDNLIRDSILISIPFLMVSITVGLSWNWKVWPVAAAVFTGLFVVFFTTVFTNGTGIASGAIGSLGYWLEQQGVRRGDQPQYYYTLLQVPVYEYMFALITLITGLAGLSWLFERRNEAIAEDEQVYQTSLRQRGEEQEMAAESAHLSTANDGHPTPEADASSDGRMTDDMPPDMLDDEDLTEEAEPEFNSLEGLPPNYTLEPPRWARPYDHEEELAHRRSGDPEYLGGIPFLPMLAYWAAIILIALTMAGEKMPWLTTHVTLPLIFISGWYVGHVLQKIRWSNLRQSGWILFIVVFPIFLIALMRLVLPVLNADDIPFRTVEPGLSPDRAHQATGRWIAALIAFAITGYFILRLGAEVGLGQTRRLMFATFSIILAVMTMRSAWMFSFIEYDYPTEFGVYAHSGPAVKTIVDDINYIVERVPEGRDMRIVYDSQSSWPMTWYVNLNDYTNTGYFVSESSDPVSPGLLENATVVVVGSTRCSEVGDILGEDDYYRFDYIRLWWPMQEYFSLNIDRVSNVFEAAEQNPAAELYREGMWDIWWSRDYTRYGQAMCVEEKFNTCVNDITGGDPALEEGAIESCLAQSGSFTNQCARQQSDRPQFVCGEQQDAPKERFALENWPVSSSIHMYVRNDVAVRLWDAGFDGQSVSERLVPDPENAVETTLQPVLDFGNEVLNKPQGIATDAQNNVYIADTDNNRVTVYDAQGNYLRAIGAGEMLNPMGVAVSPLDGNVYVADTWNHQIAVYSPEGNLLNRFGAASNEVFNITEGMGLPREDPRAFYGPRAIDVDLEGFIYISDTGSHRIRVYDPDFNLVRDIGTRGSGSGQLAEPAGVVVHPISGDIYVADTWNQQIAVFRHDGTFVRNMPVNMWRGTQTVVSGRPYITISPDGTLILVSDMDEQEGNNGPRVVAYDLNGNAVTSFNAPEGSLVPTVQQVAGLTFGNDGRLYVVDAETSRVVVFPGLPAGASGSIAPVPNPDYGTTDSEEVSELPSDNTELVPNTSIAEQKIRENARSYWFSLTTGDFETYASLLCEAAQDTLPADNVAFNETVATDFLGMNANALEVNPVIVDESRAIAYWGGFILNRADEFVPASSLMTDMVMVQEAGEWKICPTENYFRPGGG